MKDENIPWSECPKEMTNDIAYEFGNFKFPCSYDIASWEPNKHDFKYVYFFRWENPSEYATVNIEGKYICSWVFQGHLDESKFTSLEHKRHYIRGIISSYACSYSYVGDSGSTLISGCFANSFATRDRVVKWIKEILENKFEDKNWEIKYWDETNSLPGLARFELLSNAEILEYLLSEENYSKLENGKEEENSDCQYLTTPFIRKGVKVWRFENGKEIK